MPDGDEEQARSSASDDDGAADGETTSEGGTPADAAGEESPGTGSATEADEGAGSEGSAPSDERAAEPDEAANDSAGEAPASAGADGPDRSDGDSAVPDPTAVPPDVRKYERFKKIDGSTYERANEFLRDRTYITAREWAIARLCADFRTETGVEMTKIGEHLPQLVPFMTDTYSPQAVNQARHAFEEKVRKSGATFLYGAMCDFFTAEELDDVMYEATEVAKFLLEVEGIDLAVEEELAAEESISSVMREVRESSAALRHDEVTCPDCGHSFQAADHAED